ncbi:amino acid permease [Nocardia gamkensis]|uniref:Amino acid permease n=1 Tax=Nocardia gamkensis TaxID=352869 RepID=A0A7X6L632_9NOCA|nr:amino acid permease [Nocardia gamkensis]
MIGGRPVATISEPDDLPDRPPGRCTASIEGEVAKVAHSQADENSVEAGGYRQELERTLGSFQVFAISFAFISVAVGIFATYDDVLRNAGPVGIWLWIVAAVGQALVALVVAQFAARIPLSGSSYQWASRLADPKIGWWFGWVTFCYLAIAVVAVDNALASQAFMPLAGIAPDEDTARVITLVVLFVQAVLAIASTRLVSMINTSAVGLELGLVVVLAIALVAAVVITGRGAPGNLASRGVTENAPGYFTVGGGLMLAMLMGLGTLVGFDAAANLAEEAKDPHRSVPRAIVGSVVAAGVLGLLFLIALTVAIDDIPRISASGSPVAAIMRDQLGPVMERTLLAAITFAFFGAGMVVLAACSRLVFAMSRDARFPAHRLMRRVDPRTHTPVAATILIFLLGVVLMIALPGDALLELITASTILPALIYASTVVLYLAVRRRLDRRKGAFDLGRFELPVAIGALVWSAVALFVLVTPSDAFVPVVIVAGLVVTGGVFFLALLAFDRQALETEPGDVSVFEH